MITARKGWSNTVFWKAFGFFREKNDRQGGSLAEKVMWKKFHG